MVKLADRITNLQPPPAHWSRQKAALYREQAIAIHAALKNCSAYLATRLQHKIETYQNLHLTSVNLFLSLYNSLKIILSE